MLKVEYCYNDKVNKLIQSNEQVLLLVMQTTN
jgi:hypothetical protein